MITKVATIGNSLGVRLDKKLLQALGLRLGDILEISKTDNEIILKPQHNMDWFLEDYERPDENEGWEYYNQPKGRELW
ncbi:MAG: hypothetical protein LBT26_05230 [Clostridiales Family XIII bacterium]|jgi:antitoxin component of MazEF toxin-antitoxin module|nr:hypothetical protein [Clostridiales Family XIII bacterium]